MADNIVPQDDLPDNLVPAHDLPDEGRVYDPREQVPRAIGAGAGAVAGAIGVPVIQSGVNKVQQARVSPPPRMGIPHPDEVTPGHTPFKPTGRTVEDSLENWKSYNEAQLEAAKKIRQESKLHKKYPGFTRAVPELEIPPLPANAAIGERLGQKLWPTAMSDIGHFVQGVSEYKLPFIGKVGPLAGHILGGAATGSQAVDAYNRLQQGDVTGSIISGVGALGTGTATLPTPPLVKGVGAGVGLTAEAINAYRDAMARGQIEHGAPEAPENVNPMGDTYAQGGSVQHFQVGGLARLGRMAKDLSLPAAENAARTQIIGTLPTYGKAADIFAQRGATGQAIDFGAGLGKGAELLGPGTHTYEPFAQNWNPTFANAKDIPSDAYGRLTNLNVLNVVPREARDEIVQNIGRVMEPGGAGIVTTRGADVMKAQGRPGPEPTSIITSRDTYQKGFTKQELEDYMRYMLGQGYDINKINLGPAGVYIQKKAEGGLAQTFDPQGSDYDYQTALAHGMGPDGTGENQGHWGSVAPVSDDEQQKYDLPEDSYVVLKGRSHPTFHKAEAAENERGSKIVQHGNRYYSVPGLAAGGLPPKPDANEGGAFIGYPQINRNRQVGSGTGFLDALVGAPPSRTNILNPSDYSYMEGYEKGEPYGIAGMVAPFAGSAVKPLAREIGTRAFMGQSLTPKMMRGLMPEAPAMGIIKSEKGGNWMPGNIRPGEHWTPEDQLAETLGFNKNDPALENWVNTQLTRYVKNDMGTPGDPIRALADQGILHYKPRPAYSAHNNQPTNLQREAELKRTYANTPEGESALTSLGKDWETNVDAGIKTKTIGPKTIEAYGEEYPWLKNAEGKKLHSIDDEFLYSHLGFDHIVDVLREQIAAGQLRPESLKSLSVPQAVQRTHEYNLAKEKAMQKIKLQADSEMPVAKEYPEGYKWLELKHPTDKNMTEAALKYEGDAMGHCVGGYCPDVLAGDTKIYSLRDAKGEPHVTVEVKNKAEPWMNETHWDSDNNFNWKANAPLSPEMKAEIDAEMVKKFGNSRNFNQKESRWDFLESELRKRFGEPKPKLSIEQIKGKQNAAPKDEYKKFVQDFVRSGNWERVNEAHNAGLKDMAKTGNNYELTNVPEDIAKLPHTERYWAVQEAIANKAIPQYATEEEVADAIRKYARKP
jgi:PcfJ-like protein